MSAIAQLFHAWPLAWSATADLKELTWTFQINALHQVKAGSFVLVPAGELEAALKLDAALCRIPAGMQGPSKAEHHSRGDYRVLCIEANDGSWELQLQTEVPPSKPERWGRWYGCLDARDTLGRRWTHSVPWHVVDDYGYLVEVTT